MKKFLATIGVATLALFPALSFADMVPSFFTGTLTFVGVNATHNVVLFKDSDPTSVMNAGNPAGATTYNIGGFTCGPSASYSFVDTGASDQSMGTLSSAEAVAVAETKFTCAFGSISGITYYGGTPATPPPTPAPSLSLPSNTGPAMTAKISDTISDPGFLLLLTTAIGIPLAFWGAKKLKGLIAPKAKRK